MKPWIAASVALIGLAGCDGGGLPLISDTSPEVAAGPTDTLWYHVLRGQCVAIDGTPADEAALAGGESRVQSSFEGGAAFTYPVEAVYVNDTITAIYVQGNTNCATFVDTVL